MRDWLQCLSMDDLALLTPSFGKPPSPVAPHLDMHQVLEVHRCCWEARYYVQQTCKMIHMFSLSKGPCLDSANVIFKPQYNMNGRSDALKSFYSIPVFRPVFKKGIHIWLSVFVNDQMYCLCNICNPYFIHSFSNSSLILLYMSRYSAFLQCPESINNYVQKYYPFILSIIIHIYKSSRSRKLCSLWSIVGSNCILQTVNWNQQASSVIWMF